MGPIYYHQLGGFENRRLDFSWLIGGYLVLPGHFPADISPEVNFGIIADLQEMYFR